MDKIKVVRVAESSMSGATQTKVGYIPILRGDDFGSRTLDEDNTPSLYETKEKCEEVFEVGEDGCVAIAEVTWREAA